MADVSSLISNAISNITGSDSSSSSSLASSVFTTEYIQTSKNADYNIVTSGYFSKLDFQVFSIGFALNFIIIN